MITVYWAMSVGQPYKDAASITASTTGIRAYGPEYIKDIEPNSYNRKEKNIELTQYNFCPAYRDHLKNLYVIRSPIDYNLKFRNDRMESDFYGQSEFDELIHIRSLPDKLISLAFNLSLFTMEESLEITQEGATLHSGNFIDNAIVIPGKFDLAKWPRPLELAFHMKTDSIEIAHNDPLYYLRFHTKENIQFKRFLMSRRYFQLTIELTNAKNYRKPFSKMDFFYKMTSKYHKIKTLMMREIEANLLE